MEILNFKRTTNSSSIAATFSVNLEKMGMTLHNFKLIRTKQGSLFVAGPSYSETRPDGKKDYLPYVEFAAGKEKEFKEMVMERLKPLMQE